MTKQENRGGARAGAGRKPDPSRIISFRVKKADYEAIEKAAETEQSTVAEYARAKVLETVSQRVETQF